MCIRDSGKLRLNYECNPLAFIIEQAGGLASSGKERILDIKPKELHQRTPVVIGSRNMVLKVEEFVRKFEEEEQELKEEPKLA